MWYTSATVEWLVLIGVTKISATIAYSLEFESGGDLCLDPDMIV